VGVAAAAGGLASSAVIEVDGRKMFLPLPPQWPHQAVPSDRFIVFVFAKLPNGSYVRIKLETR
jgi:hypothetical protein